MKEELLSKKSVVSVGEKPDDPNTLVVFVTEKLPSTYLAPKDKIPSTIDGYNIEIHESGEVRKEARKSKHRPAPAGISTGHEDISAGTLGTPPLTKPAKNEPPQFLTNAHVAAPPTDVDHSDPVYQPGPHDGGTSDDKIGLVMEWSKIHKDEPNYTDSALVTYDTHKLKDNSIYDLGPVHHLEPSTEHSGEFIKSGRTTGVTTGRRIAKNVTIRVRGYYPDETVTFEGVDGFESFSSGGDSGSLVCYENADGHLVGTHLLFAGSPQQTFCIPLAQVFDEHGTLQVLNPPEDDSGNEPPKDEPNLFEQLIDLLYKLFQAFSSRSS